MDAGKAGKPAVGLRIPPPARAPAAAGPAAAAAAAAAAAEAEAEAEAEAAGCLRPAPTVLLSLPSGICFSPSTTACFVDAAADAVRGA